mmetsp:Transcript_69123/g.192407  ORF Transcript_69123/g.192407 Transcript_69123/m.192407 type:complete len:347 (+) Transcript_69123:1370-2410(+)
MHVAGKLQGAEREEEHVDRAHAAHVERAEGVRRDLAEIALEEDGADGLDDAIDLERAIIRERVDKLHEVLAVEVQRLDQVPNRGIKPRCLQKLTAMQELVVLKKRALVVVLQLAPQSLQRLPVRQRLLGLLHAPPLRVDDDRGVTQEADHHVQDAHPRDGHKDQEGAAENSAGKVVQVKDPKNRSSPIVECRHSHQHPHRTGNGLETAEANLFETVAGVVRTPPGHPHDKDRSDVQHEDHQRHGPQESLHAEPEAIDEHAYVAKGPRETHDFHESRKPDYADGHGVRKPRHIQDVVCKPIQQAHDDNGRVEVDPKIVCKHPPQRGMPRLALEHDGNPHDELDDEDD